MKRLATVIFLAFIASLAGIGMPLCQRLFIKGLQLPIFDVGMVFLPLVLASLCLFLAIGWRELSLQVALKMGIEQFERFTEQLRAAIQQSLRAAYLREPTGKLFNHLSQDITAIGTVVEEALPLLVSAVWPVIMAPIALYYMTGLDGLTLVVILLPGAAVTTIIALVHAKLFSTLKIDNDLRISGINELIKGMDILRMTSNQDGLIKKISDLRRQESRDRLIMAVNGTLMNVVCFAVPALTNAYALYLLLGLRGVNLNAEDLFASFWVCSVFLAGPYRKLPVAMVMLFDGWTSYRRVQATIALLGQQSNEQTCSMLNEVVPGLTVFYGASGTGKTHTLNLLNDQFRAYASYCSELGFLFSGDVYENVTLKRDVSPEDKLRVAQILRELGLEGLLLSTFLIEPGGRNLSGGMRQRLMLARAAYFDREFIFLDNSLSALDAENYRRILEVFILKNWKTKRVVLASNDSEIQKHAVATVDFDKAGLGGVGDHG